MVHLLHGPAYTTPTPIYNLQAGGVVGVLEACQVRKRLYSQNTCLPPMLPAFDSQTRRHMWVEFVVGSRPCSEEFFFFFFSGSSGFSSPQ